MENHGVYTVEILSAYHLYGNFGENLPSIGTGIFFFGTENRNGIELYHLQNTRKFFAFSREEGWYYWKSNSGKSGEKVKARN